MPYDNISVTAFILWDGKALLAQRSDDDDFLPGYWEQVGGKVDPGETWEEALVREVKEEAGIEIRPLHSYNQFEYIHRDKGFMCEYAYICELVGKPDISLGNEHKDYKWLELEELDDVQPMSDYMRGVMREGFEEV